MMVLAVKKIVFSVALLAMSISLSAQQKQPTQEKQQPNTQEHALVQRLYETQQNGSDSDFYEALARRLAISMGYTVTLDTEYTKGARFVVSGI